MPKKNRPQPAAPAVFQGEQRINKVLAAAGLGSRRLVDELIEQGRVEIDGKVIQQVGVKIDPDAVTISVDGEPLKRHRPIYFALHKPEGVLCTNRDPQGRARVVDMVPNQARLFPVGRLDAASTGLILLTNDGELSQRLTHPKHGVPKRYAVVVAGQVELDSLKRLQRGIYLAEGRAKVDQAKLKRVRKGSSEVEITLSEGKNREIRRVLARLGHKVVSLKRIAIGPLKLGELPEGAYRPLSSNEVSALYAAVEELKRARRLEKKARKKKLAQESAVQESDAPAEKRPRNAKAPQRDTQWDTLPSLKKNPFSTDEDIASEDEDFGDESILVRDHASPHDDDAWFPTTSSRSGAVIADDEDALQDMEDDEFDDDGSFFDDDDELDDEDSERDGFEDDELEPDDFQRETDTFAKPKRGSKSPPSNRTGKPQSGRPQRSGAKSPRVGTKPPSRNAGRPASARGSKPFGKPQARRNSPGMVENTDVEGSSNAVQRKRRPSSRGSAKPSRKSGPGQPRSSGPTKGRSNRGKPPASRGSSKGPSAKRGASKGKSSRKPNR